MRITIDTNVLLRYLTADDARQHAAARGALAAAELIVVPLVVICEAVWTMRRFYKLPAGSIAKTMETFLADDRVACDQSLAAVGLEHLRAGGDFADAVIAADGRRLGGESFATFDRHAAMLLERAGYAVVDLDRGD